MRWIAFYEFSERGWRYEIQIDADTGRMRHRDRKLAEALPEIANTLWRDGEPPETTTHL